MIRTPALIKKKITKARSERKNIDNASSVKRRRKIRATEDFNQLNRTSLALDIKPKMSPFAQSKMIKKTREYPYLPKVLIDEKENSSPNTTKQQPKNRKRASRKVEVGSSGSSEDIDEYVETRVAFKRKKWFEINDKETQSSSECDEAGFLMGTEPSKMRVNIQSCSSIRKYSQKIDSDSEVPTKVARKSVRFLSPKEKTDKKRNTFELEKPTTDIDLLLSINECDGTPGKKQIRTGTPFPKKSVESSTGLSKQKLDYSRDSVEDVVFEDPKETEVENDNKSLNITFENKIESAKVSENTQKNKPGSDMVAKSSDTPNKFNTKPVSLINTSWTKTKPETPKKNEKLSVPCLKKNLPEFNSMTPDKFGTRNKNLKNNLLHKSMLDIEHKSPQKQHGFSVKNLVCSPSIAKSKSPPLCKLDGDTNTIINLDQSNENVADISLNMSQQSFVGMGLNSTKKNLRRSTSAPSIEDIELPSPIRKSETPKRKSSSIIDLVSPNEEWSCIEVISPLVQVTIKTKSINTPETNDMPKRTNSTRKRWNKSIGVEVLDSSGNTFMLTPRWKSDDQTSAKTTTDAKCLKFAEALVSDDKRHSMSTSKTNIDKSVQKSKPLTSKPSTRKKMPNFALIHQMAYERMEDLQQMTERKAARALQLLSGKKPESERQLGFPKCRKPLQYSPAVEKKEKIPAVKPITNTSIAITKATLRSAKIARPVQKKMEQPKVKSNGPRTLPKEELKKRPLSKLGFKTGNLPTKSSNKEEVKAAVARSSILKSTVETRRVAVQNIRSNRRFELLMKMRAKK